MRKVFKIGELTTGFQDYWERPRLAFYLTVAKSFEFKAGSIGTRDLNQELLVKALSQIDFPLPYNFTFKEDNYRVSYKIYG